ncbi:MAG: reverse transcriptase family protein, partial [Candidatus Thiodiazotropha sp.]
MRGEPTVKKQLYNSEISISFLNVCGLQSKLLFPEFESYLNTHDIIGVAETKTCEDDMITFPNYSYFSKHRKHYIRRSGGLGIFLKENILPFIEVIDIDSEFLMLLKISHVLTTKDQDLFIAFVYLPPEGSDYSNNDSMSEIESVLLPYIENCKYFYIMGDLNARTSNSTEYFEIEIDSISTEQYGIDDDVISYMNNVQELQNHKINLSRQSQDRIRNNYGNKLLQLCRNNNLYICNGRLNGDLIGAFTCTKGSVIDYLIANIDGLLSVNNFTIHDFSPLCSDVHCAISFVIKAYIFTRQNDIILHKHKRWEPSKRESFINNIIKNKINELNLMLENSRDCLLDKSIIDDFASKIKDIFHQSAKKSFKSYTFLSKKVKHSKPWFGLQCQKNRKKYQTARKNNNIQKSNASKRIMINASKKYKATVKKYYSNHIVGLQNKIRKLRTEKPKDYWKLINSINKKAENIPIEINDMFDYFKTINKDDDYEDASVDTATPEIFFNLADFENGEDFNTSQSSLNNPINESEINIAIKALKLNKACGTDGIVNEYIISTKNIMMPIYIKLFNIIIESGIVPSDWVKGNIIPIYKNKGNKTEPANYRPITLLSCIGKVFTSILNTRLNKYLEENRILNETQSGFRKEYSTIDNIMVLYSLIEYFKSKKNKLYCCFIDFTKAFDNVWRAGLWQKLLKHGINGKIINVIQNMYKEIKSCITVNGSSSGFFSCEKGVR